eukprot:1160542-Pelagomonas_calceolata.AAC.4
MAQCQGTCQLSSEWPVSDEVLECQGGVKGGVQVSRHMSALWCMASQCLGGRAMTPHQMVRSWLIGRRIPVEFHNSTQKHSAPRSELSTNFARLGKSGEAKYVTANPFLRTALKEDCVG